MDTVSKLGLGAVGTGLAQGAFLEEAKYKNVVEHRILEENLWRKKKTLRGAEG